MSEPIQVIMPAEIRSRMTNWLATAGMRLYRVPVKDDVPTYMVGVDMSQYREPRPDGSWPVADVVEAYGDAVAYLVEPKTPPKSRKRRPTSPS